MAVSTNNRCLQSRVCVGYAELSKRELFIAQSIRMICDHGPEVRSSTECGTHLMFHKVG